MGRYNSRCERGVKCVFEEDPSRLIKKSFLEVYVPHAVGQDVGFTM
jgi:hypothetical protein